VTRGDTKAESFLEAGEQCAGLFEHSESHVCSAREHAHFFYGLLKWTVSLGCALVGWLCLTNSEAPLLMSPIWPAAIILEGSFALASAALAVHEASFEAVLQSYCEEMRIRAAAVAATLLAAESDPSVGKEDKGFSAASKSAADRAAALFGSASDAPPMVTGYSSFAPGGTAYPHSHPNQMAPTCGLLATCGPSAAGLTHKAEIVRQVPPSYSAVPLAASALAAA